MQEVLSFSKAVTLFLMDSQLTKRDGTYRFYAYYLSRMVPFFPSTMLEDIKPMMMTQFIYQLKHTHPTMKAATVNKFITSFKACFRFHMPYPFRYRKLKEETVHIPYIDDGHITRIFQYYQHHLNDRRKVRNFLLYALLLDTGLRINELLHVQWEDIHVLQRTLTVMHSKDHVQRFLFFTSHTRQLLLHYQTMVTPSGYVFIDFKTHQRLCVSSVETITQRLMTSLKITSSISPHKWRHTFATRFLTQGGNLEVLRILLGHHNLRITQKYLHVSQNQLKTEYRRVMDKKRTDEKVTIVDDMVASLKEE